MHQSVCYYISDPECPDSTSNIVWIDGSSVNLGCIGFMRIKTRPSQAEAACKTVNPTSHLIEIFNEEQVRFLMTFEVRSRVEDSIGVSCSGSNYAYWWIGAQLKSGTWYWIHSNQKVSYVSNIGFSGGSNFHKDNPYGVMSLTDQKGFWWDSDDSNYSKYNPLCQLF